MFVRTGTIRKGRGGSNRRSVRRPRRDSNSANNGGTARKSVGSDEPSSSSIGHRLTPNGDTNTVRSVSNLSLAYDEKVKENGSHTSRNYSMYELQNVASAASNNDSWTYQNAHAYQSDVARPSPAKSQATAVVVSSKLFADYVIKCTTRVLKRYFCN